ncbi:MAG: hypothetical protein OEY89_12830 [Gammaproteobacteria bacterium]|nr:hypothetical protein [Gammaproteobacteria bacterium]
MITIITVSCCIYTTALASDLDKLTKSANQAPIEIEKFFFKAHRTGKESETVSKDMIPVSHDPAITGISEITSYREYIVWNTFSIHYQSTKQWLSEIFLRHYRPGENDPSYMHQDIDDLASYYSQFPDVIRLINLIEYKTWSLQYKPRASYTKAIGSMFGVNSADIYFDTRAAVQHIKHRSCKAQPVCISSPADVLLHELIHAAIMLTTNEFIEDGGMLSSIYPFKHEYRVIQLEKQLYKKMTKKDSYKRPNRKEHSGKYVAASCVSCIE